MIIRIYDIEVFSHDWIVVFKDIVSGKFTIFHNDSLSLKAYVKKRGLVLGGFNNKHYDNWVVLTMISGGSPAEVKRHNDYIIGGGNPWDYPFIAGKRIPFSSFDLRDDIPDKGLSLKAIEGNLNLPIVESSVPFDIDRPLTREELDEVTKYCIYDVNATEALYNVRKEDYIDAKLLVADMYDIAPERALSLTNAKLSAEVLNAQYVERSDERDYRIPPNIDAKKIPKIILDFFMQIRDESIPSTKLFGAGKGSKGMTLDLILHTGGGSCPVTYAWGGVHGAPPCVMIESDDEYLNIMDDVGSLYPNSMLNFGYTSRSMKDPDAYRKLVIRRLEYKKAGDKQKANALKLVVNTVYGAMLNLYNDLADRWAGRSVCISNQLAMTLLIVMLAEECSSIWFFNINTDGLGYRLRRSELDKANRIVAEWSEITGFSMERTIFKKIIQKDVNNYIGIMPDGKYKAKGGYVSLYKGGSFKTNSLQIIHKAIVEYLVNGIDPEDTIRGCKDIFAFQQIIKTGSSYEGSYHYIDGERVPMQKVNRVYAVKDKRYGSVVKGKWITEKRKKDKATGKMISTPVDPPVWTETTISECPEHTGIDNENKLTVDDLDMDYYIDMARKRIDKYINVDSKIQRKIDKITSEVTIMSSAKNIYEKILEARVMFRERGIKKSGKNQYAKFLYFTLDDIIPQKQEIFKELGLCDNFTFTAEEAILTIYDAQDPTMYIQYCSPLAPDESMIANPIQKIGAIQTYVRRYLYVMALDIIEADAIEEITDAPENAPATQSDAPAADSAPKKKKDAPKKSKPPVTTDERKEIASDLTNADGEMTAAQRKGIISGLKKLRARYMDEENTVFDEALEQKYSKFISTVTRAVKSGMTAADAEKYLIEIGDKINEQ